jgi:hypothetical protein
MHTKAHFLAVAGAAAFGVVSLFSTGGAAKPANPSQGAQPAASVPVGVPLEVNGACRAEPGLPSVRIHRNPRLPNGHLNPTFTAELDRPYPGPLEICVTYRSMGFVDFVAPNVTTADFVLGTESDSVTAVARVTRIVPCDPTKQDFARCIRRVRLP